MTKPTAKKHSVSLHILVEFNNKPRARRLTHVVYKHISEDYETVSSFCA